MFIETILLVLFSELYLIPHQSVLENVEIALTLSGVSKKERKRRLESSKTS